jgi:acyl-CoA oxidase
VHAHYSSVLVYQFADFIEGSLFVNVKVTPEGQFVSKGNEKATFGGMVLVRASIVHNSYNYLSQACTIAVRYSSVRRQSELKPG